MDVRRCRCFFLALIVLLGALHLRADVTGSIGGYVRDSSGAVLPNATLTVIQTSTGYSRTATTDSSGHYSILALPPGNYRLTAANAGFFGVGVLWGFREEPELRANGARHIIAKPMDLIDLLE